MAFDAAERLRELIAVGEEIPYEVREPGDGSPLCRYEPQTEVFVHDHSSELRELDSFGAACAALEIAGLAAPYLERMGIGVPEDPRKRAEISCIAFLCRLWMGSSDFTLEADRLDAAIDEVEQGLDVDAGQIEVIVPLRGLQMPVARLELDPVSIVRADTVEVPGGGALERRPRCLALGARLHRGGPGRGGAWRRRQRRRPRRSRSLPPPDHHAAPVQGRWGGARPARLDTDCRRPLAPDRDRLGPPAPGRVSPHRGRARRPARLLARAHRPRDAVRAPGPGPPRLPDRARPRAQPVRGRARAKRRRRGAQRPPSRAALPARGRRPR